MTPTLSSMGKLTLIITMFMGRVGVLTMGMAISIRIQKTDTKLKYPSEKVMVG